jgi:hypothetical protein
MIIQSVLGAILLRVMHHFLGDCVLYFFVLSVGDKYLLSVFFVRINKKLL